MGASTCQGKNERSKDYLRKRVSDQLFNSLRDTLWLTVVCALSIGWVLDRYELLSKTARSEMLDWKFRAESLQKHIESTPKTTVSIETGHFGQSVLVHTPTGVTAYKEKRVRELRYTYPSH
jgi:hypothetical protein